MIAAIAVVLFMTAVGSNDTSKVSLSYSAFTHQVNEGNVSKIDYDPNSGKISGEFDQPVKGRTQFTSSGPNNDLTDNDLADLRKKGVEINYVREGSNPWLPILVYLLPIAALIGFFVWMNRRAQGQMGAVMNIGKSRAKVHNAEKPQTTFGDVAGYEPVKEEIKEVVDFLKNPGKFKEIGARIPRGVLLVGPPGTGKTLIARAVAGEAGVPFVAITGSDFMEMFVGVGAARVRDLFQTARKQAPAIIFIDEIDSIGRKRGAGLGGGHDEREQTLNQMLAEMDGFESGEGIVMIAATNRPDILDPALLRPGRFDRQIMVPLPTLEERIDILKVHFRDKKIADDVSIEVVARGTPGMSGADLANLVNESALFAVRRGENAVHKEDFEDARDRVLMGLKRPTVVMNDEEKEHTAYHEAGHAIAAYVSEHADPVHKVTILPTGMALGMTQQLPEEERYSHDKDFLEDMLAVLLGGRVAEDIVFGSQSTGASNDLVRGTEIARRMVREWGMSDRIGPMAWGSQGAVFLGEDLVHTPRLLRRDRPRHRRGGRADPAQLRGPHTRAPHEVPHRVSTRSRRPCSSTRRSTGSRSSASSTARSATAPVARARSCSPTGPSRPSTTRASRSHPSPTDDASPPRLRPLGGSARTPPGCRRSLRRGRRLRSGLGRGRRRVGRDASVGSGQGVEAVRDARVTGRGRRRPRPTDRSR